MRGVLLIITVVLFSQCGKEDCSSSIEATPITIKVERLEGELFGARSAQEVQSFLSSNRQFSNVFLDSDQYPHDSVLAQRMYGLVTNPSIDTLYQESLEAFKDLESILKELESSLGRLKTLYPETRIPTVQTFISGLYKDLFISNDHIMIGLDFFIGENASYKPREIPGYILRRYNTEHLPAIITKFIASQYVSPGQGESMIAEMIDFGKTYYLLSQIMPCTDERILIGYTQEEWNASFENEAIIWANFIENEVLYETNHRIKQKFLAERPNVYEIGDKCPGRIGAWVGWQIVNQYMDRSNITVQQLLADTDHNKIFTQSGYKPN